VGARVVSMPCWEVFAAQPDAYREQVLPTSVSARVAVEAGIRQGWDHWIGPRGAMIGMTGYGGSAPAGDLFKHFGITTDAVVSAAQAQL